MGNHRESSVFGRHGVLLDLLAVLAPTVATVIDMLALLTLDELHYITGQFGQAFFLAFFLFPSLVAFVINWWHPALPTAFRPFLAAVPQLLVVPLMFVMFLWIAAGPDPGLGVGDPGFGLTEAERKEMLVVNITDGSIIGLMLTMPTVLAGYMGSWLGQSSRRGSDAP
jgi:hypothetical protein